MYKCQNDLRGRSVAVEWAVIEGVFEEAFMVADIPTETPLPITERACLEGWDVSMSATGIVPDSTSKCRQGVLGLTVF